MPLTITDPNQAAQRIVYDNLGRITEYYGPRDETLPEFRFNFSAALTRVPTTQNILMEQQVEPGGTQYLTTTKYLDGFGRAFKIYKPAPSSKTVLEELAYDWNGLESSRNLPRFSDTTTATNAKVSTFDSWKRPLTITEPDGSITSFVYSGLKTTITDAKSNLTYKYYDVFGRLVRTEQVNDDGTYATTYEYDPLGRVVKVLDANYNVGTANAKPYTSVYDSLGRVISTTDPFAGNTSCQYDLVGNLIAKTDAKNNTLRYEYDTLNRMVKKSVQASGATSAKVLARYVYDEADSSNGIGRLTRSYIGENTLDSKYDYDPDGNIIATQKTINGIMYSLESTFDSMNRLKTLIYPDSFEMEYTYDALALQNAGDYATFSNWKATGQPQTLTYGNGVTTSYTYNDNNQRLTSLVTKDPGTVVIQSFAYGYDTVGNITSITDNAPLTTMHTAATSQTFTYYKLYRLKSSSRFGDYSYDRIGNITAKEGVSFSFSDPAHPNCPTSGSSGFQATYDANGNLKTKRDKNGAYWVYTYNGENMLIAVHKGKSQGKEVLIEEYFYDSTGMRTQKNTYDGATVKTTNYVHFGNNVLYESGAENARYILAGGCEIARFSGANIYYTHRDHLGSSSVVTDQAGQVVNWNANHPFGENWQISPAGTTDLDKHRFTGKETDASTGLSYFGARYYDSEVGRFTTVDSAKDGENWYGYCYDNPIKYNDPSGRSSS